MTKEEAKKLKRGQIVFHNIKKNVDGTPQRWRVTRENTPLSGVYAEVRVNIRRGIREHDEIDGLTFKNYNLYDK